MAKKEPKEEEKIKDVILDQEYISTYKTDLEAHDDYIENFDSWEAMLISQVYDQESRKTRNGITDGAASTILIERASRVVGQLGTGVTKAAGKKDKGKALLMDILRQKHINPNANAQMPFLNKIRSWELYSGVYGYMPMYVDWHVSPTGYIGPDCWLWNPRNFIPQAGRSSIADMDYCHAIAYVTPQYLKDLLDEPESAGWDKDALLELISIVDSKKNDKEVDQKRDTYVTRKRQFQSTDEVCLATRYEAGKGGRWCTFAPEHGSLKLRDIENPHNTGKIPFIVKPAIPLFDSFYNLGDMQRFRPLQFAKDGLTNFYFQGIKTILFPPLVVNSNGVIKHTVTQEAGAVIQELVPNSVRRLETSNAGLSTYNAASSQLQGMLLNNAGTTDTKANAANTNDPGFGKTPEALRFLQERENTRDNQQRAYLEAALEELYDYMFSLYANIGTEPISLDLYEEDIMEIMNSGYEDVMEMVEANESGETGRLIIKPSGLKGVQYKFYIDQNSTAKSSKAEQKQSLVDLLEIMKSMNNFEQQLANNGKQMNWEFIFQKFGSLSDIDGMDQMITDLPPPPEPEPQQQPVGQMGLSGGDLDPSIAASIAQLQALR